MASRENTETRGSPMMNANAPRAKSAVIEASAQSPLSNSHQNAQSHSQSHYPSQSRTQTRGTIAGHPLLGHLPEMRKDRMGLHHRAARLADIVPLRVGVFRVQLLSSPELAHEVLVGHADAF